MIEDADNLNIYRFFKKNTQVIIYILKSIMLEFKFPFFEKPMNLQWASHYDS